MLIWIIVIFAVIMNAFYLGFRYARSLENKEELPLPGKVHLYCLGDGLTYGVGVLRERRAFAWPYLLNVSLGRKWQILNFGVPDAAVSCTAKVPLQKSRGFLRLEQQQGTLCLLMVGTNDSKLGTWHPIRFENDYMTLLRRVAAFSVKYCVLIPPAVHPAKNGRKTDIRGEIVNEIAETERTIAANAQLPVIDLHALTSAHPEWYTDDGVHLNRAGNQAVADAIYEQIGQELLTWPYIMPDPQTAHAKDADDLQETAG